MKLILRKYKWYFLFCQPDVHLHHSIIWKASS